MLRSRLLLAELGIPKRVMPTGRICAMYDKLRQDIVKVLTLQKSVAQLEGAAASALSSVEKVVQSSSSSASGRGKKRKAAGGDGGA